MPEWISVKDKLPADDGYVLVYAVGRFDTVLEIARYSHHKSVLEPKGWIYPYTFFPQEYTITHWMLLPEAPKEETK